MKRVGNLFEHVFTREALYQGYLDARRAKRRKRACFQFERRLGAQIEALHRELHAGNYRPRPYFTFVVHERKPRLIHAPAFRDCVVQHAIYRVIYPIFNRTFIEQSFACRVGKGTHRAADYAQRALRAAPAGSYTLKLDLSKFFYRIDRRVLQQLIERKIKDRRLVEVMMLFADDGQPTGIPIGNLLSQLYALIYLSPLDHFVKRELGVRHYCRYVDDFVLFGLPRDRAVDCRARIEAFIQQRLGMAFSKAMLAPATRGVNFVGYRTWASRRFIRKHALFTARQGIDDGQRESLISSLGHARYTHSLQHLLTLTRTRNHDLYHSLPDRIRRLHHLPAPRAGRRAALHGAMHPG